MELNFNLRGAERKALAQEVGTIIGCEPIYKGTPSFEYAVMNLTIDRLGSLIWDERTDNAIIYNLLEQLIRRGYSAEGMEAVLAETSQTAPENPIFEELRMTLEEELGLGRQRRDPVGEDGMQASDVPEPDSLAISYPAENFNDEAFANLEKLVESKTVLIKKSLGIEDLSIKRSETEISFDWFSYELPHEEILAYAQFISQLCKTTKSKKRVTAKSCEFFENEKFTMRVWLIGLGMIGEEYKTARKLLLQNSDGNSAWRFGAPERTSLADEVSVSAETATQDMMHYKTQPNEPLASIREEEVKNLA